MARWCPCDTASTKISYNSRMKHLGFSLIALTFVLAITALPSAAKTKVELKDAQGKSVGTVILWGQGSGARFELRLHYLSALTHGLHIHENTTSDAPYLQSSRPPFHP